ncbi:beta-eliminating lyase-related protein [Streptomyces sp. NPDC051940]|uniref:threonine aldolase family protein n=1 Tax=Streptomyces sp. NPDC051940 TaxID=3155675 RepID=UPI00341214DE
MSQDDKLRHFAAQRAARRALSGGPLAVSIEDALARMGAIAVGGVDLGQPVDVYGTGVVEELERRTAEVLGKEDAAYFPTGTMAQQVALRCWAGRTGSEVVVSHPLHHLEVHERDAYAVVSGLRAVHVTDAPRTPSAAEVAGVGEPFGTLMLELPMREPGFVLPSWEELTETVGAARERDAVVHFDGARLWETTEHFRRPLPEIAGLADSVYVSFYKSLGAVSGAALAGPATLIDEARTWRHRYGGQLFQQWPAVLTALYGLEHELPRLPEYVAHAKTVAAALASAFTEAGESWHRVYPAVPHTHQFQVWLPYSAEVLTECSLRMAEEQKTVLFRRWTEPGMPPGISVTEVTVSASALEWTAGDVAQAVDAFLALVRETR